jgi:hypothetical protein
MATLRILSRVPWRRLACALILAIVVLCNRQCFWFLPFPNHCKLADGSIVYYCKFTDKKHPFDYLVDPNSALKKVIAIKPSLLNKQMEVQNFFLQNKGKYYLHSSMGGSYVRLEGFTVDCNTGEIGSVETGTGELLPLSLVIFSDPRMIRVDDM